MIKNFKCSGYSTDIDENSPNPFVIIFPSKITAKIKYYNFPSNFVPAVEKYICAVSKDRR